MIKEIKYNGYTETPSDYECQDGDLAGAMNVLPEDGSLKGILPPTLRAVMPSGCRIVFIHSTTQMKHYIIYKEGDLSFYWIDREVIDGGTYPVPAATITSSMHLIWSNDGQLAYLWNDIEAVGNTLMIMDADGIHYFLWKEAEQGQQNGIYTNLGTHIPELTLSFGLQSEMVRSEMYEHNFTQSVFAENLWNLSDDEERRGVTNDVLGKVNKFIKEKADEAGKFIFPFMVRYAYRLYDGQLTMHSAPVLMVCSSDLAPLAVAKSTLAEDPYYIIGLKYYVMAARHTLDYAVARSAEITALRRWGDIVKSIDIFISAPIYTYDQSGEIENLYSYNASDTFCISSFDSGTTYQKNNIMDEYRSTYDDAAEYGYVLNLPHFSSDKVRSSIRDCHDFYLLESVSLDSLTTTRQVIGIEEGYLDSLRAREVMTDDYDSHDSLIPRYAFSYNQRMNIANLDKSLFDGFPVDAMTCYTNSGANATWQAYVHIRQDGKETVVKCADVTADSTRPVYMVFYPNINAYKITLYNGTSYREYPLDAHDFLNGAFYFQGWSERQASAISQPTVSSDATVRVPNKIYTSEVSNPFYFPLLGINTVGTGEIYGIAAAVKALSEGQFGQFPLYAFTSEGVWALQVSSTGTYSTVQPVTRDVCVSSDSITSMDSAVLFATDRGIMVISGSKSVCISDELDTRQPFQVASLPSASALLELSGIEDEETDILPFKDFARSCRMLYDYVGQRIIVYLPYDESVLTPVPPYAYVYSLDTKKWGMMPAYIIEGINSYPECLALTDDGLVDFSDPKVTAVGENEETVLVGVNGLVVTRPLKLDYPNTMKTVRTIVQRGVFGKGHVRGALYGSRDLLTWYLVASSTDHYIRSISGTPYKYFRIALPLTLTDRESLWGCTVEYELKETNKVR